MLDPMDRLSLEQEEPTAIAGKGTSGVVFAGPTSGSTKD